MANSKNGSSRGARQKAKPWHRVDARLETSKEIAPNMGEGVDTPSIRESGATGKGKTKKIVKPEPTS